MPLSVECVCCSEIREIVDKRNDVPQGVTPVRCITEHPGFQNVCLDVWVLQAAYHTYCQHYGSRSHHTSVHK